VRKRSLPSASSAPDSTLARGRLTWAAALYATVYLLTYAAGTIASSGTSLPGRGISEIVAIAAILLGYLAAVALHRGWVPDSALLSFGMAFWALGALGIDLSTYDGHFRMGMPMTGLTWASHWIVFFALLVPATPRRMLFGALLAATAGPVSLGVAVLLHGPLPMPSPEILPAMGTGSAVFMLILPYYICAAMAYGSSRVVYRLRRDASRARELGSYRLERRIGAGGMGEVWLARHRYLARPAAVKVLHPTAQGGAAGSATLHRRFEREAQATAGLRSVHTVDLYDFGVTEEGSFYYAMEYLTGLDLEDLVRRHGPQPPGRVIYLLSQVCASLQEAHERDLVHRDIKPSNLFLTRLGTWFDVIKVLDFGLVTTLQHDESGEGATRLTMEGKVTGSPATMPPETALEGALAADARSDIYSVGCVAYWLLSGRQVFEADTPMRMVLRHVQDQPEPLAAVCESEIPAALADLVHECLAKRPEERPASVAELARRLAASGVPEWNQQQAGEWWGIHGPALI
jgi:serine/threonine-protein kinase